MSSVPKGGGRGIEGSAIHPPTFMSRPYDGNFTNPTMTIPQNQHIIQESPNVFRVDANVRPYPGLDNRGYMQYQPPFYAQDINFSTPYIPAPIMSSSQPLAQGYPAPDRKRVVLTITDPETGLPINLNKSDDNKTVRTEPEPKINPEDQKKDQIRKEMSTKVLNEIKKKDAKVDKVEASSTPTFVPASVATPAPLPVEEPIKNAQPPLVEASAPAPVPVSVSAPVPAPAKAKEPTPTPVPVEVSKPEPIAQTSEHVPEQVEKIETVSQEVPENIEEFKTEAPAAVLERPSVDGPEEGEIVDEPETEVDAEEEARRKEEEEAEKRREREHELDELKAKLLTNEAEVSVPNNWYGRAFLYCVRDIEKEFKRTTCPLTQKELENFGIDILSMPKGSDKKRPDFAPSWLQRNSTTGQRSGRGAQYSGRNSHNEHRSGRGSGSKKAYSGKGLSIDRPMEKKMTLSHRAEDAWKPDKLKNDEDDGSLKVLLRKVRALLNKITPTTKEELIKEFLSYKICQVHPEATYTAKDQLKEVVNIIFDKAVEEPKFCPLYSELCKRQVDQELSENSKLSELRNALLNRAQATFVNRDFQETSAKLQGTDEEESKAKIQQEIEEFEGKFRRRKFGNIIFIGQLYCQQLLSTRIVNWCLYDLIRHTHKVNEVLPEPPYDEESLQCAVQMLESLGKQLEYATDFPGKQYLDQTLGHLQEISSYCTNRMRFMILGIIELRANRWQLRKVVDQGPKKITEIHNEIKQEQMENLQQRESYDKRQGLRTGSGSLRRQGPPPMRNSSDNRFGQGKQDKRAAAVASSKLTTSIAPPRNMSLSQVGQEDKRKTWKTGATGGGVSADTNNRLTEKWNKSNSRDGSENRKLSLADDRTAALAAAQRMGSTDQRSPSQDAEENEEEKQEREQKMSKMVNSISSDLDEVNSGDSNIEQMSTYLYDYVGQEKYGKPTVADVFQRLVQAAVEKVKPELLPSLGHVLCKALEDNNNKRQALTGIANYCFYAVKSEAWVDFPAVVWGGIAKVIINAIFCETALFDGPRPCLNDFADAFINAGKDTREDHSYELLVTVLRMMAEKNVLLAGEDHPTSSSMAYHELSFLSSLDKDRLEAALKACQPPKDTGFSSLHALLEN